MVALDETVHVLDSENAEHLPVGLDGSGYQWVDLDGEGVPGVLTEQAGAWFYKRNLSNLPIDDDPFSPAQARFAPVELVATTPSSRELGGSQQLMDLGGDGQLRLVQFGAPFSGYYERTQSGWRSFTAFESVPTIDWSDPNLRTVDLTGDGHADVLITEAEALRWYPSRARDGFAPAEVVCKPPNEEDGPALVFADGTQTIHLADLSGDGLTDLVRIRNGEVSYWPCHGYGRFGAEIRMANPPLFDTPDQFDPERIRLADVDGSGTTDIIYLGRDRVTLYFNLSGNGWSDARPLQHLPAPDDLASVLVLDLLGNGTACLVWSSPLPGDAGRHVRYIDLMGGQKPHLLVGLKNNLGAETKVHYASSTRFYLQDRARGKPWATRLPFPVHVVERIEIYDRISGNRYVARSDYHHGYFDGPEREFRGFGMVEQWDTEEIGTVASDDQSSAATNLEEASFVPPVLTRTWFHTGAYLDGSRVSLQFEDEYYREGDPSLGADMAEVLTDDERRAMLLDDSVMPSGLSPDETREAYRALKGSILRQEVYARDGTEAEDRPYTVSERNYSLVRVQPRGENRHAVFFVHPREAAEFQYERKLFAVGGQLRADPRVTHALTFEVDPYGNVLRSAAVGYGRRHDDPDQFLTSADREQQRRTRLTFTQNRYTEPVLQEYAYRTPLPCETRLYEVIRVESHADLTAGIPGITNLFRFDELRDAIGEASDGNHDIDYEDFAASGSVEAHPYRRLVEHTRTLYRSDSLSGPLQLGALGDFGTRALPYQTLALAFTPGLLADVYRRDGENLLPDLDGVMHEAGYVAGDDYRASGLFPASDSPGRWWVPSGQMFYSPDPNAPPATELSAAAAHFFVPRRFVDPFEQSTTVRYDTYDLLPVESRDPLGNTVQSVNDYRVLQPAGVTDPNGNRSAVAHDTLGLVTGMAVMGKDNEPVGDSIVGFAADLDLSTIRSFVADPRGLAPNLLQSATTRTVYDIDRFARCGQPPFAASILRETHASDPLPPGGAKFQVSILYSDGFGRELQTKIQAESGNAAERQPDVVLPNGDRAPGALVLVGGEPQPIPVARRWIGTGRTVYNNKGKPVRQYEPFFSSTHLYEPEPEMVMTGVTPILAYDPVGRVVATLHPDHSFDKVVFDPWRQDTWDANDTSLIAEPSGDADVGELFARLPITDYLPTWHEEHASSSVVAEQQAAAKTAAHAGTFTAAYFDTLARTFLTVADNGANGKYPTRVEYDIEGNQRAVTDARGNTVMRYDYDVRGTRIRQESTDAGTRWMLGNVVGKPVRAWDSRGFTRRFSYDELQRPVNMLLREGSAEDRLVERIVYGESQGPALNHRGRVFQQFDGAGVVTNVAYDFKGNLLQLSRQVAADYKTTLDWSGPVGLESHLFTSTTQYDALNRPVTLTAPDGSVVESTFNDASLLERVDATLAGATEATTFVADINYNAKRQRELIVYGSGVRSVYQYDARTFRLARLETLRGADHLQDLSYFYDPVGNITRIADAAQPTVYYDNQAVEARADYLYDAVYRLIEASGREHDGTGTIDPPQNLPQWKPHYDFNDWARRNRTDPNDKSALRRYRELFEYDEVGNIERLTHEPLGGTTWTRRYEYAAESNRLLGTSLPGDPPDTFSAQYVHDTHGNMTAMPHLPLVQWDFRDQLQATQRQIVNGGPGERTYYVYDASGQRVRKVTDRQNGTRKDERIYVGGFEVYHDYDGSGAAVTLERETLHVMDGEQRITLVERKTIDSNAPSSLGSVTRYQLDNHLGSAVMELDQDGEIISYEEYYPYGSTAYQAGRSLAEVSLKRYRYTGKERDEETGFYYHGARYYAPWLGRWTSSDPAGLIDGPCTYAYAKDSPTTMLDDWGTQTTPPALKGIAERFTKHTVEIRHVAEVGQTGPHEAHGPKPKDPPMSRNYTSYGEHPIQGAIAKQTNPNYKYEKATSTILPKDVKTNKDAADTRIRREFNARRNTNNPMSLDEVASREFGAQDRAVNNLNAGKTRYYGTDITPADTRAAVDASLSEARPGGAPATVPATPATTSGVAASTPGVSHQALEASAAEAKSLNPPPEPPSKPASAPTAGGAPPDPAPVEGTGSRAPAPNAGSRGFVDVSTVIGLGLASVAVVLAVVDVNAAVNNAPPGKKLEAGVERGAEHGASFALWAVAPVPMFFWNLTQMETDAASQEVVLTRSR